MTWLVNDAVGGEKKVWNVPTMAGSLYFSIVWLVRGSKKNKGYSRRHWEAFCGVESTSTTNSDFFFLGLLLKLLSKENRPGTLFHFLETTVGIIRLVYQIRLPLSMIRRY